MSYKAMDGTRQWDGSKKVPEERMAVKMQSFARTGITPEQHSQPDVEAILEKMEDVRSLQETKEDYKEWKKQNQNNEKD